MPILGTLKHFEPKNAFFRRATISVLKLKLIEAKGISENNYG